MIVEQEDYANITEMLAFRQQIIDTFGPDGYALQLAPYKAVLEREHQLHPSIDIIDIANKLIDVIDNKPAQPGGEEDIRELAKAMYVLAALELQGSEFVDQLIESTK